MNELRTGASGGTPAQPKPPAERWPRSRWITLVVLVFLVHVALLFSFGNFQPAPTRSVHGVPTLGLAEDTGDWLALNAPTLFVLPNLHDFAEAAWLRSPPLPTNSFRWSESPAWLKMSATDLGAAFIRFMQTNQLALFRPEWRPPPQFSLPELPPLPSALAGESTLRIEGKLSHRRLLTRMVLPSWPYPDILAPSVVHVLVDAAGKVASVTLLSSSGYDRADERALQLARAAQFAPLTPAADTIAANPTADLMFGRLRFDWHTVPPAPTNAPPSHS